ncbi:MAG: hypothetical protein GXO76_13655 [Calditrichaeota bacterium]|nr:hypothetical protein [Calditrichota bacterium]
MRRFPNLCMVAPVKGPGKQKVQLHRSPFIPFRLGSFLLVLLLMMGPKAALAQGNGLSGMSSWGESAQVVAFFFIILTLATILNRLFELLITILKLVYEKSALLQDMWEAVWESILKKLQAIDPRFNDPKLTDPLKEKVRILLIQGTVFLIGSVIGVWLCAVLDLGMLFTLKITAHPTFWDFLLTGMLVASGTEPIHAIFRIIEAKKDKKSLEAAEASHH